MKLRTRIALLAGAVIFFAALLGSWLSFREAWKSVMEEARIAGEQESKQVMLDLQEYGQRLGDSFSPAHAVHFLKARQDDYTILVLDGRVLYNQTVLDLPTVERASRMSGGELFAQGRRLLVFYLGEYDSIRVFHLVDITNQYLRLYRMLGRIAGLSLGAATLSSLALLPILRRALRPLQELSQGTRAMAEGAYHQRVPEAGRDEVARLGRDFNKMAQAVEHHIARVTDSEEKKTLFMGSLTHELKTPLTAISGYAQTLRRMKLSPEDRELALEYICRESARLDRLSKKMLRLLELDRETELVLEPVPVEALLQGAREACLPAAQEKGVEIQATPGPGEVLADRDLLTDALINLTDNAVKASPPGGAVRLYEEDGDLVVEDQGPGIPAEELDRLTEPFYMVDKSRSRKSGGAGLGLALTAVILRRHGLGLRFDSRPGEGTRARVGREYAPHPESFTT